MQWFERKNSNPFLKPPDMPLAALPKTRRNHSDSFLRIIYTAVFNTNAENELAYIYHALVHKGYEKERILNWIDKVRQFGMDSSFVRRVKKPSEQIREMEQILEQIREYITGG